MVNQAQSDTYRFATVLRANPFTSAKWDNRLGKSSCCADVGWNFPGKSSYAIFHAWVHSPYSEGALSCWMAVPVARYHKATGPHAEKLPWVWDFRTLFSQTCWRLVGQVSVLRSGIHSPLSVNWQHSVPCFNPLGLASGLSWTVEDDLSHNSTDSLLVHPEHVVAVSMCTRAAAEKISVRALLPTLPVTFLLIMA